MPLSVLHRLEIHCGTHNAVKWRGKERQIKVHLRFEWSSSLLSNFSPCRGSVDCEIGPIAAAESDSSALCLPFHTSPFGQLKAITWYLHPLLFFFFLSGNACSQHYQRAICYYSVSNIFDLISLENFQNGCNQEHFFLNVGLQVSVYKAKKWFIFIIRVHT